MDYTARTSQTSVSPYRLLLGPAFTDGTSPSDTNSWWNRTGLGRIAAAFLKLQLHWI